MVFETEMMEVNKGDLVCSRGAIDSLILSIFETRSRFA